VTAGPPDPFDTAAGEYHAANLEAAAARRAVARAQKRVTAADQRLKAARGTLAAAAVEAFKEGRRTQAEIIEVTGYSRERVRQILRQAGVDPEESAERARASRRRKN
jgi:hypothetical protein